jgi:DNA-binding NarL/FixJ family response regulator
MEAIKPKRPQAPVKMWTMGEVQLLRQWANVPPKEIAHRLNRSVRSVRAARVKYKISPFKTRGKGNPVKPEEKAKIFELHHQGLSGKKIAKELGRGQWTISNILKQAI